MTKNVVSKRLREYFKELIEDNGKIDVVIDIIGLEVRKGQNT